MRQKAKEAGMNHTELTRYMQAGELNDQVVQRCLLEDYYVGAIERMDIAEQILEQKIAEGFPKSEADIIFRYWNSVYRSNLGDQNGV